MVGYISAHCTGGRAQLHRLGCNILEHSRRFCVFEPLADDQTTSVLCYRVPPESGNL